MKMYGPKIVLIREIEKQLVMHALCIIRNFRSTHTIFRNFPSDISCFWLSRNWGILYMFNLYTCISKNGMLFSKFTIQKIGHKRLRRLKIYKNPCECYIDSQILRPYRMYFFISSSLKSRGLRYKKQHLSQQGRKSRKQQFKWNWIDWGFFPRLFSGRRGSREGHSCG